MGLKCLRIVFGISAGVGALAIRASAHAVGCTDFPPVVCTTTSESFFYGITLGQPLQFIDFETLPNGQPSVGGTQITPQFNYTSLGVTFTAPLGTPTIGGFVPGTFDLHVSTTNVTHTWLRADFVHPSAAIGIHFPGTTTMAAFDIGGSLITSQSFGASGGPWFIGIYSEIPIAYVTVDRGSDSQFLNDFVFSLVPEPASAVLLVAGALVGIRTRRRA